MELLLKLFWAFFQIGLFSIGGGYAAMPLIQEQVVQNGWMSIGEFTYLITISQMTPGPIAVNSASFIGARMAGVPGAIIATLGCILPSCVIVMLIAFLYRRYVKLHVIDDALRGLRPAVVGRGPLHDRVFFPGRHRHFPHGRRYRGGSHLSMRLPRAAKVEAQPHSHHVS